MVVNAVVGMSPLSLTNLLNAALTVMAVATYFTGRRRSVQRGLTLAYLGCMLYGTLFVWARIGAMPQIG